MSEWAKNFTSSTTFNFETVNESIKTNSDTANTTILGSEIRLLQTVEETK
jgi:hypothetical protein